RPGDEHLTPARRGHDVRRVVGDDVEVADRQAAQPAADLDDVGPHVPAAQLPLVSVGEDRHGTEPTGAPGPPRRVIYRGSVRSLAEDIRHRTDEELVALLGVRPDLARPQPADLTALAARASTRASTTRAIDHLDLPHLAALQACVVVGEASPGAITPLLGCDAATAAGLLEDLATAALLWRPPAALAAPRPPPAPAARRPRPPRRSRPCWPAACCPPPTTTGS